MKNAKHSLLQRLNLISDSIEVQEDLVPERTYLAEALEARVLYSAAPVEAPEQITHTEAVESTTLHDFDSIDTFASEAPSIPSEGSGAAADANEWATLASLENLTEAELEILADAAAQRWESAGLSAEQLAALEDIEYEIVDLTGNILGQAEGNKISIDLNAAGEGWYVDATPFDDEEFGNVITTTAMRAEQPEQFGVDLLSVIMHEQGHRLGLEDIYDAAQNTNVMYGIFTEGERRLAADSQADGAVAGSLEGINYATLGWNNGSGDGLWKTAGNWSTGGVPVADDVVNINNGDTVVWDGSTGQSLPARVTINLTGNSTLDATGVIRLNDATINVESGSTLASSSGAFWDLGNADIRFEDGAIVTIDEWEHKGTNVFEFELGATGFTTLTPNSLFENGVASTTYRVDMANYTGGAGTITLVDFGGGATSLTNGVFEIVNQDPNLGATLSFNSALRAIELVVTSPIHTWDGGAGDGLWSSASNWDPNELPAAGDTVNISGGSTVEWNTNGNLPSGLTINVTGNSTLANSNVLRLNNATINVESGSTLTSIAPGNGFWDLANGDINFEDGAIVTLDEWEQKGTNVFSFELGASGFTTLTPNALRANGAVSTTYQVDMSNYTGSAGVITLVDFGSDATGLDNATFTAGGQYTLSVLNEPSGLTGELRWNDTDDSIELVISGNSAPDAVNDLATTNEDTALNVDAAAGLLSNDTDAESDPLKVVAYDAISANGIPVVVNEDGSFSYDPTGTALAQSLTGPTDSFVDTFTYTIADGDIPAAGAEFERTTAGSIASLATVANSSQGFTIELGFQPNDLTGQEVIFETGGTAGFGVVLDDEDLIFTMNNNSATRIHSFAYDLATDTDGALPGPGDLSTPLHVIYTYDTSAPVGSQVTLYINGNLISTTRAINTATAALNGWGGGDAGGFGQGAGSNLGGAISGGFNHDLDGDGSSRLFGALDGTVSQLRFYGNGEVFDAAAISNQYSAFTTPGASTDTATVTVTVTGVDDAPASSDDYIDTGIIEQGVYTYVASDNLLANDGIVPGAALNYEANATSDNTDIATVWENLGTNNNNGDNDDWDMGAGITYGATTTSHAGITNAYSFDGSATAFAISSTNTGADAPTEFGVNDLGDATFEIWFKPTSLSGGDQNLWETGGGTGAGIVLSNNLLRYRDAATGTEVNYDLNNFNADFGLLATDDFIQVAASYDITNGQMRLAVNGREVATANANLTDWDGGDGMGMGFRGGANQGGFGGGNAGIDEVFSGEIAIFRIYTQAFDEGQAAQNFKAVNAGTDIDGSPLTAVVATTTSTGGAAVTVAADGSFTYDASATTTYDDLRTGWTAIDTFTYQVTDGVNTFTNTAHLTIRGETETRPDAFVAPEDSTLTIGQYELIGNDEYTASSTALLEFNATQETNNTWHNAGTGGSRFDANLSGVNLASTSLAGGSNFTAITQAYDFSGTGGANIPTTSSISGDPTDQDASFELVFKPASGQTGTQVLWEAGGAGTGSSIVYDADNGQIIVTIDAGTDTDLTTHLIATTAAGSVSTTEFNHLVVVYNRDNGGSDTLEVYLSTETSGFNATPTIGADGAGAATNAVNDWDGGDDAGIGRLASAMALAQTHGAYVGQMGLLRVIGSALDATAAGAAYTALGTSTTPIITGVSATSANGATVTLNANGSVDYTPTVGLYDALPFGETAIDTFTYTIDDGSGGNLTETVTITIEGENDAVTATDDDFTGVNSTDASAVLGNIITDNNGSGADSDTDITTSPDTLIVVGVNDTNSLSDTENLATASVAADGTLTYNPGTGLRADQTQEFTYTVADQNSLTSGLVFHTAFGEASGGTAQAVIDLSGSGRAGSIHGDASVVTGTSPVSGDMLSLDGTGDYVVLDGYQGADITGSGARTISAWINTSSDGAIVSYGGTAAGQKFIFRVEGNVLRVEHNGGNVKGSTIVNDGQWHHVAMTLPSGGSNGLNDITFYVDGVAETFSATSTAPLNTTTTNEVHIGRDFQDFNRDFNGSIDDLGIWNRELTADEIANIYNTAIGQGHSFQEHDHATVTIDVTYVNQPTTASPLDQDVTIQPGVVETLAIADIVVSDADATRVQSRILADGGAAPTFDLSNGTTFTAGTQNQANGYSFDLTFTPDAADIAPGTTRVLWEIGGTSNGSGVYMVDGIPHFVAKMGGAASNQPAGLTDTDFTDGDFTVSIPLTTTALTAGVETSLAGLFTLNNLEYSVNGSDPANQALTVGGNTNWHGDLTVSLGVSTTTGSGAATNPDAGPYAASTLTSLSNGLTSFNFWNATTDFEIDPFEVITATLTMSNPANGSLTAASGNGETYTAGTGVWTVTGSLAEVNTALAAVELITTATTSTADSIAVSIDDGDEDGSGAQTGTISFIEPLPVTVTIETTTDASETGPVAGQFTVTQSGTSTTDTVIAYSIDVASTATAGTDYTTLSGTVTIAAGDTTATIDVAGIVDDAIVEGDETVTVRLDSITSGAPHVSIDTSANSSVAGTVVSTIDLTAADLASAGLDFLGFDASSNWILNTTDDRAQVSFGGGNDRATLFSTDSWQNDEGFTLDVTFNQTAVGTRFSFGIVDVTDPIEGGSDWLNSSRPGAYGIGFSTDGELAAGGDALAFNNGSTSSVLSTAQGNIGINTLQTLSITVTADGYSYSLNGGAATTGSFSFDTSRTYRFISFAQKSNSTNLNGTYFTDIKVTEVPAKNEATVTITDNDVVSTVYVDDDWTASTDLSAEDLDDGTSATELNGVFGLTAFGSITNALAALPPTGGTIIVNAGTYDAAREGGPISIPANVTLEITGPDTAQAVTIDDLSTAAGTTINIEGASTLTINTTSDQTIAGTISGSGNLAKNGTGRLTLAGDNSYTGNTNVNAGILALQHNNALGTTDGNTIVETTGQVLIDGNGLNIGEAISVQGQDNRGNGTWEGPLRNGSGTNEWSGQITLLDWSRISQGSGALTVTGGVVSNGGANLGFVVNNSSGTVTFETNPIDIADGRFESHGGGTTILNVAGNEFGDVWTRWSSTLRTDVAGALTTDAIVNVSTSTFAGTLNLNGNDQTIGGLIDEGTGNRTVTSATAATLTIGNAADHTYNGIISGALTLTKSGAGVQTLSGDNSYTGITTISAGTLALTASGDIDQSPEVAVVSGATFDVSGRTSGGYAYAGDLTGTGTVNGDLTIGVGGNLQPGSSSGDDEGTLTITGDANVSGDFDFTIDGVNTDLLDVDGAVTLAGTLTFAVATDPVASTITIIDNDGADAVSGTFTGLAEGDAVMVGSLSYDISYVGGDGNDVVLTRSAPTIVYVDDNWTDQAAFDADGDTDDGTTGVQTGTFGYDSFGSLAAALAAVDTGGTIIVNSGTYAETVALNDNKIIEITGPNVAQAVEITELSSAAGTSIVLEGSSTLTVNNSSAQTIASPISGTGSLVKDGTGTLVLSTSNTFTGGTTVNNGTLDLQGAEIIRGTLTVDGSGKVLVTAGGHNAIDQLSTINLQNGGTLSDNSSASYVHTVSATINFINGGTITSEAGSPGNGTFGNFLFNSQINVTGNGLAEIDANRVSFNFSKTINVEDTVAGSGTDLLISSNVRDDRPGTLTKIGGGTVTFAGGYNLTGANSTPTNLVISDGTVEIAGSDTWQGGNYSGSIINNGTLIYDSDADQTLSGIISGSGNLIKEGAGELTLTAANTYGGTTDINGGTLDFQSLAGFVNFTGDDVTINNGSTLQFTRNGGNGHVLHADDEIIFGSAGGGTLELVGSPNFVIRGTTFTTTGGATNTITGGSLNMDNNGPTIFNVADGTDDVDLVIASSMANTQGISKTGAGTMEITSNANYTGTTSVAAGTLLVTGDLTSASGAITVASGATLGGSGTAGGDVTIDSGGTLAPGKNGIGTLTVDSNVVVNGTLAIEVGAGAANTDLLSVTGSLDVSNATLNVTGTGLDQDFYEIANYTGVDPTAFSSVTVPAGYGVFFDAANDRILLAKTGSLGDYVWYDVDGDGVQDANEAGAAGVNVAVQNNLSGSFTTIDTATTDANGDFTFNNLPVNPVGGTGYRLVFTAPTDTEFTVNEGAPSATGSNAGGGTNGITPVLTLNPATTLAHDSIDAGLIGTSSISGLVWDDSNDSDGVKEAGQGVDGITVNLYLSTDPGTVLRSTTTAGGGVYSFDGLLTSAQLQNAVVGATGAIDYIVEFVPGANSFSNVAGDSDADTTTGRATVTLTSTAETALDAGFDNFVPDTVIWGLVGDTAVVEGTAAEYTLSLGGTLSENQTATVQISLSPGTAVAADYGDLDAAVAAAVAAYTGPGSVSYDAGTDTITYTGGAGGTEMTDLVISLSTVDDTLDEQTESFTVQISNPGTTTLANVSIGTGTQGTASPATTTEDWQSDRWGLSGGWPGDTTNTTGLVTIRDGDVVTLNGDVTIERLQLGVSNGSETGEVDVQSGTLNVQTPTGVGDIYRDGNGTIRVSGGSVIMGDPATNTINGSGDPTNGTNYRLGHRNGGEDAIVVTAGTYTSHGRISSGGGSVTIDVSGTGVANFNGSHFDIGVDADNGDSDPDTTTINIADASRLHVTSFFGARLGVKANAGDVIVNQTGGTFDVDLYGSANVNSGLQIATQAGTNATYNLSGGTLDVSQDLYFGAGNGRLNIIGSSIDAITVGDQFRGASTGTLAYTADNGGFTTMQVANSANLGGALVVDVTAIASDGSTPITLIDAGSYSGSFSSITVINDGVNLTAGTSGALTAGQFHFDETTGELTFVADAVPIAEGGDTVITKIVDNDADEPEIQVTGNGVSITAGDTSPTTSDDTDFGAVSVGGSNVTHTFTINNTGDSTLDFSNAISLATGSSSDFTITTQPSGTVAPGGSTTFQVTFAPTTLGAQTATIVIDSNDDDEGRFTFAITGEVVNQAPTANNDTNNVTEAGGAANAIPATSATGNVVDATLGSAGDATDTDPEGDLLSVTQVAFAGGSPVAVTVGGVNLSGLYGTLNLAADGSYTYTLDDAASDSLDATDTVSEVFTYTLTDGSSTTTATLSIDIQGSDDAPIATDTTGTAQKAGAGTTGADATGNVLSNAADPDADDTPVVASISYTGGGTPLGSNAGGTVSGPTIVDGQYGTLTINPDGTYTYVIDGDAAATLGSGDVVTEEFTYVIQSLGSSASGTAKLTITVTGADDSEPTAPTDFSGISSLFGHITEKRLFFGIFQPLETSLSEVEDYEPRVVIAGDWNDIPEIHISLYDNNNNPLYTFVESEILELVRDANGRSISGVMIPWQEGLLNTTVRITIEGIQQTEWPDEIDLLEQARYPINFEKLFLGRVPGQIVGQVVDQL